MTLNAQLAAGYYETFYFAIEALNLITFPSLSCPLSLNVSNQKHILCLREIFCIEGVVGTGEYFNWNHQLI